MNQEYLAQLLRDRMVFLKAATALLWATWLISIGLNGFRRDAAGKPIGTDHVAFYSAARLIDEGRSEVLYDYTDFAPLSEYQASLAGAEPGFYNPYRNPPFYALLYLPTSRLSYPASYWIWTAVSAAMLVLGIVWLGSQRPASTCVLALSFYPVFATFSFGQNSLLSFGILALCYRLLARGRLFVAGLTAGLLLYKPQLLLGVGLWWVLEYRRYWAALGGLAAAGLFWAAFSLLLLPEETWLFVRNLPRIAAYDQFMFYNLQNPRGFGRMIAGDNREFGNVFGTLCSAVGLVLFVLFWKRHRGQLPLIFAAAVFLTLWASPHTMIYEWTLALIPAILLWENVPEKRDPWLLIFAISWIALFVAVPISRFLSEWTRPADPAVGTQGWAIQIAVPAMAVAAVWAGRALRPARNVGV